MFNDPTFFWKNFRLGTELQISGSFIYNALYFFDKMEHFYHEHECFEFLYNTAVGIERLEKIAIVLLEHNENTDQNNFEKTLITHDHLELLHRIKKLTSISLGKTHNKFLQLLSDFYRSTRYDRFGISSVYHQNQDKEQLIKFVSDELKIEISAGMMFPTEIDDRIRKFIGKTVSTISTKLYDIINDRAHELNMYTYELDYSSKAFKIFNEKGYSFFEEKTFQKEILIHLLNKKDTDGIIEFIKTIEPLELESYDTHEYIKFLLDFHKRRLMLGELQYHYEEHKLGKERLDEVNAIGADNVSFGIDDDEELE
jgi:hypothetical protein